MIKPLQERFLEKIIPDTNGGCWLWTAATTSNGYGRIKLSTGNRKILAHRVSWQLYKGEIPPELLVLHKCDIRACCNPDHLFLGTNADNMADRNTKRRHAHGETHASAKLTELQVLEIRALRGTKSQREIGEIFGVTEMTVYSIQARKTWRHIV